MEEKICTMLGLKQEEEIELELGLSIGSGNKRSEKMKPIKNESVQFHPTSNPNSSGIDTDSRNKNQSFASDIELEIKAMDPTVKREIEALRRQEAKKRRLEKQQRKGINSGMKNSRNSLKSGDSEPEFDVKERECKRSRVLDSGLGNNAELINGKLNFTGGKDIKMNPTAYNPPVLCPVMYSYPPVQYIPFANGFQYPCVNVMPFWTRNEQNMMPSLVNQSFMQFQSGQETGANMGNGCISDQNSRKAGSCSFSAVSDHRTSSSHSGGSEGETRSNSSHAQSKQHKSSQCIPNHTEGHCEQTTSSHLRETVQVCEEKQNATTKSIQQAFQSNGIPCTTSCIEQNVTSNVDLSSSKKIKEEAVPEPQPVAPVSPTINSSSPGQSKESKKNMLGKPPKPHTQNQNAPNLLPHTPCVSTTGNGPNGKTINGFLYRYTKEEISILCVCHRASFSPAEFVQHAGGTDISNPLKHITVIPSSIPC